MHLLAPLFAFGALLAAVPVLIHLFGRDRAPHRRFPAARLLVAAQRRRAPRARVEQWILVSLRLAAILALVLALSRPIWERPAGLPQAAGLRQTAVIIVDDSLSMSRRQRRRTLFEQARGRARDLVRAFADGSEAAIISTTGHDPLPRLERDRAALLDALDHATPSLHAGSSTTALARAASLLGNAGSGIRRIYLVSDMGRHGFDPTQPRPSSADADIGVTVVPVGDGELPNDAVVDLQLSPTAERGARRLRVVAQVRSDDWAAHTRTVTLSVDGRPVARGVVELERGRTVAKHFTYELAADEAPRIVELLLEPDSTDSLAADDRRGAALDEQAGRLLVVDGAPGSSRREDETFYVETALLAARGGGSRMEVIREDALGRTELSGFSAILLCNPRPSETLNVLQPFVERGGGLFISVGDNLDPALSTQLAGLLPSPIEGSRDLSGPGGVAGGALRLERPSASLLRKLPALGDEHAQEAWRAARTYRVALVRPLTSDDDTREILARFEDGTPALLERRVGKGRVIVLLTTVDRGWSDLAIQPVFPPVLFELADHLGTRTPDGGHGAVYALDPSESDPLRIDAGKVATPPPGTTPAHPPARELWHALAAALLLLLFCEAVVGLRG